jgi:membrane associated rhomboid family serine protease
MSIQSPLPSAKLRALVIALTPLAALEAILSLSELAGYGAIRGQLTAALGAWPDLWSDARGVYPGQGIVMLVSYSVLHGNFMHFAFNALWILIFGRLLLVDMRMVEFLAAFLAASAAGAIAYVLLASGSAPAVGASGGAYGLGALWAARVMRRRKTEAGSWQPVVGVLGAMAAVTLIVPMGSAGVAWQAHFGGSLLGLAWGWFRDRGPTEATPAERRRKARVRVVK